MVAQTTPRLRRPRTTRARLRNLLLPPVGYGRFFRDLWREINEDNISAGAASLAYFLMLAIFPAAIFLLSLLPYLPIRDLEQAIMDLLRQAMPAQAASLFTTTVENVVSERRGGLLSFGFLFTVWAASNGMAAVMEQLNVTYDVKDERSFFKKRGVALLLVLLSGALVVGAFGLIVFGGVLQDQLASVIGWSSALLTVFAGFRWAVILGMITLGLSTIYYFGPDVDQKFRFITPGSVLGTLILAGAALGFRFYVERFGSYEATYGSLGAVIILLLWLYVAGLVVLLGSEVNALLEHYAEDGKSKGEKQAHAS